MALRVFSVVVQGLTMPWLMRKLKTVCVFFRPSTWAIPMREQHVLWWGGLRGALALALALAVPPSFPFYNEILATAFGVVVFSVVAQGLTMPLLLRKLKFHDGNESIRRQP